MVQTEASKELALQDGAASCPVGSGLLRRYLLAGIGIAFVGVGWVGAFVPGIPTVGPLLAASYCFTRSCPWLEQRLIRNRFFAPFLHYLDGDCAIPFRARVMALILMWLSISVSIGGLVLAGRGGVLLPALIIAAGLGGTVAILRFRRGTGAVSAP